jgi:signal transduction histidine kinase
MFSNEHKIPPHNVVMDEAPPRARPRAGWLSLVPIAAAAAVNVAGIWSIALARRGAGEEASRLFAAETAARARSVERLVSGMRDDLAFLAGSAPVQALAQDHVAAEGRAQREAAESLLLVFLRSHPVVTRLAVRAGGGAPLLLMGRRGGVAVLWVADAPTGDEGAATAPGTPRLYGSFGGAPVTLEAEIAPPALLDPAEFQDHQCVLADAQGGLIARRPARPAPAGGQRLLRARNTVDAQGWSAPAPWTLDCAAPPTLVTAFMEPLAARSRTTLALNLAAMVLAALLGVLAFREAARRERAEAEAHEEARVRALERQLFHAERLTRLGQLAAGIAHEINNPLEGMANYLTLAEEDLARGDAEKARARLQGVRTGLDRAAATVRQVLAHAVPGSTALTPVDVNRVLADAVDFIRTRREFAGIDFGLELAEGPLLARASHTMLGQVASNLVINACQAQPQGGEVNIRSRREGDKVIVDVADRGPGVPPADRERIFEPFFSTKSSTGLGLSVCHAIVRQHDGDLSVGPREGGGAVFRLTLPALDGAHA